MSKKSLTLEKKKIAREIDNAIAGEMSYNGLSEEETLRLQNYSWNDLNVLKEDLGKNIVEFIGQVNLIITNPDIIANLGNKKEDFNKLVTLFFSDINNFSKKVADLRVQHEDKVGQIGTLEEFDTYNRIAIMYQALFSELATLITPTLSEIVLLISEVVTPVNNTQETAEETQETISNEVH